MISSLIFLFVVILTFILGLSLGAKYPAVGMKATWIIEQVKNFFKGLFKQ